MGVLCRVFFLAALVVNSFFGVVTRFVMDVFDMLVSGDVFGRGGCPVGGHGAEGGHADGGR